MSLLKEWERFAPLVGLLIKTEELEQATKMKTIERHRDCDHMIGYECAFCGDDNEPVFLSTLDAEKYKDMVGGDQVFKWCPKCGCNLQDCDLLELSEMKKTIIKYFTQDANKALK